MEYRDVLNDTGSIFFFRVFEMKVTEDILPQNLGRNSHVLNFVHLSNPVNSQSTHTDYRNFSKKKLRERMYGILFFIVCGLLDQKYHR